VDSYPTIPTWKTSSGVDNGEVFQKGRLSGRVNQHLRFLRGARVESPSREDCPVKLSRQESSEIKSRDGCEGSGHRR
ncbi:hypothetical protein BaRGS_00037263, partial [Batillaria attramentaria]